ncbi:SDR family oxidoreductase [Limibaculum sp. FT325]|uniref:SDR family oxidoreductase n=1 Tax=Thermohalobaculum sediminis TaxID=2939436 RepID=UPI0020C01A44|nr:SDR family oxidoreductase [Limibaculum sediminis]MCL5776584.1 SDR family oxidoreductase [Limibaculum sediminis]
MQRTLLITGASRGIGLAMVRAAAGRGDRVIACVRDPGSAADLAAAARGAAPGAIAIRAADVTDPASLAAAALAEQGAIDVVVCNAGVYRARGGIEAPGYTADAWAETMMTNVAGVFFTVRAFLPHLERAPNPKIAIISSVMASSAKAPGGSYIYRASKAAATNLARNLATDLGPRGIAVGAYHPGWVRTDMGGTGAELDAATSAAGLLARFETLDLDTTGVFEDYRGTPIPY